MVAGREEGGGRGSGHHEIFPPYYTGIEIEKNKQRKRLYILREST